ncbi:DUF6226 family protein [Microbacterium murale]|uniref:Uncharacterized protein n=1 Tax=Microbacterium murale TaxID=1081040 RepID=A0ABQ1RD75_9MICO|nr:DUF6226 family protein [Microbacterium murale]GGD66436.1 hypothetical protein GCM10007269_07070 [Microbacterium murale]
MDSYRRPRIEPVEFRDADGVVIDYGNRWGGESPPEDSYSVLSNVERFRPLHRVAAALIDALVAVYEVTVEDDVSLASDLMHPRGDVERAVRVTPADPFAASLTFVFTSHPSAMIHAGLLHDFLYPVCTCDACDEDWERIADRMEWDVQTVVAGGYEERAGRSGVGFRLADESGTRGGSGRSQDIPRARLDAAVRTLSGIDTWKVWPRIR